MHCPICRHKERVEIDTHADGYAANLQECGICGALWTMKENRPVLIHGAPNPSGRAREA